MEETGARKRCANLMLTTALKEMALISVDRFAVYISKAILMRERATKIINFKINAETWFPVALLFIVHLPVSE